MCLSPCFDGQDAFLLLTSGTGRTMLKSKLHSRITDAQLGTTLLSEVYCMRCPCKCSMRSGLLVYSIRMQASMLHAMPGRIHLAKLIKTQLLLPDMLLHALKDLSKQVNLLGPAALADSKC